MKRYPYRLNWIMPFLLLIVSCGKDNDPRQSNPVMTADDVSVLEGNGGAVSLEVKLRLDKASSKQVSVKVSTNDGTAKSADDFTALNGVTVNFQPNEIEKMVTISVVGDEWREPDETFQLKLQNGTDVTLLKETITVTLRNDDSKVPFNNTGFDVPASYPGMTLAWADEFNGTALAADTWTSEAGDGCPNLCGWGNNELQYYTPAPNNLFFQDGKMLIEAKAESYGGKNYTSARIKTQNKKAFQFGRIDIRAILPKGKGIWPAFWLLPQDNVYGGWPKSGEIDMMEAVGQEPAKVSGTVHFGPGPNSTWISKTYPLPSGNFNEQFHVFSLEWKTDQIKWYVDNILYATFSKADAGANVYPFNEKFYFIINLAVGGNLPGPPDASTVFPQWLILDYIRVYQ